MFIAIISNNSGYQKKRTSYVIEYKLVQHKNTHNWHLRPINSILRVIVKDVFESRVNPRIFTSNKTGVNKKRRRMFQWKKCRWATPCRRRARSSRGSRRLPPCATWAPPLPRPCLRAASLPGPRSTPAPGSGTRATCGPHTIPTRRTGARRRRRTSGRACPSTIGPKNRQVRLYG